MRFLSMILDMRGHMFRREGRAPIRGTDALKSLDIPGTKKQKYRGSEADRTSAIEAATQGSLPSLCMGFRILKSLLLCSLFLGSVCYAAEKDSSSFDRPDLRANVSWHPDDILIGVGGGIEIHGIYRGGLKGFFRPHYEPLIYQKDGRRVQYREKQLGALLYLERYFPLDVLGDFEAMVGLDLGGAMEVRKGFPDRPFHHWLVIPKVGFGRSLGDSVHLQLEYRYSPQPAMNGKEHRAALRFLVDL